MQDVFEIENIEELRHKAGIDDVELRAAVSGLRVGDRVKLTFKPVATSSGGETLWVRITSIRECMFRGKLTKSPTLVGLSNLQAGYAVRFASCHIHSVGTKAVKIAK